MRFFMTVMAISTVNFAVAQQSAGMSITSIEVAGLNRTRKVVTDRILDRFIGLPAAELDKNAVTAALMETGLFENIVMLVIPGEDGARLDIALEEKWSILPLPVFVATSDGITAGGALLDMNAFGINDKLFSVALALPGGWMTSAAYAHTYDGGFLPKWSVSGYLARRDRKTLDDEEIVRSRYGVDAADVGIELGKTVFGVGNVSVSAAVRDRLVRDDVSDVRFPPESARVAVLTAGASAKTSSWDGVFLSERSSSLSASYAYGLVGPSFPSFEGRAAYDHPFFPGLRASARAAFSYAQEAGDVFDGGPSEVGIGILPPSFAAASLAGSSLGLETRVLRLKAGTVSLLASYQILAAGDLSATNGENAFAHGPVFGVRMYVAKAAIPALDGGFAYNVATGKARATFGIGMRM